MKVKDLIRVLQANPHLYNMDIRMSCDSEGNGFSTLDSSGITYDKDLEHVIFYPDDEYLECGE